MQDLEKTQALKAEFKQYLISQGYKLLTPTGRKSTTYTYENCIDSVARRESMTWSQLLENIESVRKLYDNGGIKWAIGKAGNSKTINALRSFERFSKNRIY